ncbi:MAG: DUF6485 family protein [Deltaproteobacteria bacterium]|nr:DUF6485 family protein [Deltaproteobacteria bacterium]
MDCTISKNLKDCSCTYEPCSRKGKCCECVMYHRRSNQLPGCFFPKEAERTYNRSISYFVSVMQKGGKI